MTALRETQVRRNENISGAVLSAGLEQAMVVLQSFIPVESGLFARLGGLRERLKHERLQLAVLGQFKRGKSTFLNALLGVPVLPMAVVPLTAVSTFIAWRPQPLVRVSFRDGRPLEQCTAHEPDAIRDFLFRFVAEEANPKNRLGVDRVEVFYPASILAGGTVLIDTPGVGSTHRHNTDAALQLIPECDAVLFVVSADPPITEVELDYLRRLRSKTARIFFILNKADYLTPKEQQSVTDFLRKVLRDALLDATAPVFSVSARNGLTAKQTNDCNKLQKSGIAAVEDHLVQYLATEKVRLLEDAVRRKVADILSQATAEADLRVHALKMPLAELASKGRAFEQALRSIEEQRRITRDLLAGEKRRLRDNLESCIQALRNEASSKLTGLIGERFAGMTTAAWEEATQSALSARMEAIFEAARDQLVATFSADASTALSICQRRIDELVNTVRQTAAEMFNVSLGPDAEQEPFQLAQEPYWVTGSVGSTLIPDPSRLMDRFLPSSLRRARLRARVIRETGELILRNAENLRWAILRSLDETFLKATPRFEQRLDDAMRATRGVIDDALARRRDRSFAVEPEVDRLKRAAAALTAIHTELLDAPSDGVRQQDPHHDRDASPFPLGNRSAG
jgi:GTPase SAR1 family protein